MPFRHSPQAEFLRRSSWTSAGARAALAGVVVDKTKSAAGGVTTEGKWTTMKVPGYIFKTDLPPSQRGAFLKDTSRYMVAMQSAYRRYVPPQRELGDSTIRVFAEKADYDAYAKDTTGEGNTRSIGLWNPSHEELLILNQGKDVAERRETMKIMRCMAVAFTLHREV